MTDSQGDNRPPHSSDASTPPRILDNADSPAPCSDNDAETNNPVLGDIPPAKRQRLHQANKHSIYHWSVFKGMNAQDLMDPGFKVGPAHLIVLGVASVVAQLENN
ncbi:hypothetical protein PtB15_4B675 [Puccinia triticina]|nr:hypothetical protein PtB15_4B675 [Puccinia triticina]